MSAPSVLSNIVRNEKAVESIEQKLTTLAHFQLFAPTTAVQQRTDGRKARRRVGRRNLYSLNPKATLFSQRGARDRSLSFRTSLITESVTRSHFCSSSAPGSSSFSSHITAYSPVTEPAEARLLNMADASDKPKRQAPVVQKFDSAIHRINLYPVDNAISFPNTYPLDRDLSGG